MIEPFVEYLKLVGGLAGLASATFLIYDRWMRDRPIAFLHPAEPGVAELWIRNVTRESLIVEEFAIRPAGMIGVAKADDLRSTIRAVRWYGSEPDKTRTFAVLSPDELRKFPLVTLPGFEKALDSKKLVIACAWRNTRRPLPFSFVRRAKITTTIRDIRELQKTAPR